MVRVTRFIYFDLNYPSGTLTSAWVGKDPGFQFGSIVLLLIPVSVGVMFAIASNPVPEKAEEPEEAPETAPE